MKRILSIAVLLFLCATPAWGELKVISAGAASGAGLTFPLTTNTTLTDTGVVATFGGAALFADGTAAAPGMAFASDPDYGLHLDSGWTLTKAEQNPLPILRLRGTFNGNNNVALYWSLENATPANNDFAAIYGHNRVRTVGAEYGTLRFYVDTNGTLTESAALDGSAGWLLKSGLLLGFGSGAPIVIPTTVFYEVGAGTMGLRAAGTAAASMNIYGDGTTATKYLSLGHDGTNGVISSTEVIKVNQAIDLADPGAKPTCDATTRGTIWIDEGGAGVADTAELCGKAAADTYSWVAIATF